MIVIVGSYELEQIDVDDVDQFRNKEGASIGGALGHELREQEVKQLVKLKNTRQDYLIAHEEAIKAENLINGSTRGNAVSNLTQDFLQRSSGTLTIPYYQYGRATNVTLNITKGNITSIESKIINPISK